jgi:hypothetical protein
MIPKAPMMMISLRYRLLPAAQVADLDYSRGRSILRMMGMDSRETGVVEGDFGSEAVPHLPPQYPSSRCIPDLQGSTDYSLQSARTVAARRSFQSNVS